MPWQIGLGASLPLQSTVLELPHGPHQAPSISLPSSQRQPDRAPPRSTQSQPPPKPAAASEPQRSTSGVQLMAALAQAFPTPPPADSVACTARPFSGGEGAFRPVKPAAARAPAPRPLLPAQPQQASQLLQRLPPSLQPYRPGPQPMQPDLLRNARAHSSRGRLGSPASLCQWGLQNDLSAPEASSGAAGQGSAAGAASSPQTAGAQLAGRHASQASPAALPRRSIDACMGPAGLGETVWEAQQMRHLRHPLDHAHAQLKLPLPQQS